MLNNDKIRNVSFSVPNKLHSMLKPKYTTSSCIFVTIKTNNVTLLKILLQNLIKYSIKVSVNAINYINLHNDYP